MKVRIHFFKYLVLIIAGSAVMCVKDDTIFTPYDAKVYKSTVSGIIRNKHGESLSGVAVTAYPSGITTVSDPNGHFTLSGLSSGKYALYLKLVDYLDTITEDSVSLAILEDKVLAAPFKMLYRYATLKGVVKNELNTEQPNAGIQVEEQNVGGWSNINGKFTLSRVEPGNVRLFAVVKDMGYGITEIQATPDTTIEDIEIVVNKKGGTITGEVIDNSGNPVNGGKIIIFDIILDTATNALGTFVLNEVPALVKVPAIITNGIDTTVIGNIITTDNTITDLGTIVIKPIIITESIKILPGTFLATTSDTCVILIAYTTLSDSTIKIDHYEWDVDNNGSWDTLTPTCRLKYPVPTVPGTYTVKVRCIDTSNYSSNIADLLIKVSLVNNSARFTSTSGDMTANALPGQAYTDTVHAIDNDGDALYFAFIDSVSNMNLTDSIISWTPDSSDTGIHSITVTVSDGFGEYATLTWTITVTGGTDVKPSITQQPAFPNNVYELDTVTLSVIATGTLPFLYQWQENDSDIIDTVADSSTYSFIANITQNGNTFRCIVSNSIGKDTSNRVSAVVKDRAPFLIAPLNNSTVTDDQVLLKWHPGYYRNYTALLDTANPPVEVSIASIQDTFFTTQYLPDGIYFWRIIGFDTQDTTIISDSSEIWKFTKQKDTIVALEYDKVITREINPAGNIDSYYFSGTKDDLVTIRFKPDNSFDSRVQVIDPEDTLIISKDTTGASLNCIDTLLLSKNGSHIIKISSIPGNQTCTYTLGINSWRYASDNSPEIRFDVPVNDTINPNVDIDFYRFGWYASGIAAISFEPGGNFNSTIQVIDPGWNIIAQNSAIDGNTNVIDTLHYTTSGDYLITVYGTDGKDTCTYQLTIESLKGAY